MSFKSIYVKQGASVNPRTGAQISNCLGQGECEHWRASASKGGASGEEDSAEDTEVPFLSSSITLEQTGCFCE